MLGVWLVTTSHPLPLPREKAIPPGPSISGFIRTANIGRSLKPCIDLKLTAFSEKNDEITLLTLAGSRSFDEQGILSYIPAAVPVISESSSKEDERTIA